MSTTFHNPINNVSTTVGSAYTAGSHSLVVATGTGSKFGSTFPLIITASQAGSVLSILEVTGRSTDTLTISGAIEGTTDVNLSIGVTIDMRPTALAITEIQTAVNTNDAAVVHLSGTETITGAKTFNAPVTAYSTSSTAIVGTATSGTGVIGTSGSGSGVFGGALNGAGGSFAQFGTLSSSSSAQVVNIARILTLNGFDATGPLLRIDDETTSSGPMLILVKQGVTVLAADGFGSMSLATLYVGSGLLPPTMSDADAVTGSIYLGSDHLDGNSDPKLCRKGPSGNVTIIG